MHLSENDTTGNYRALSRFPEIMDSAHWHMHLELVYCVEGAVSYVMGTEYFTLDKGDLGLFWAAIPHRVSDTAAGSRVVVINLPMETLLSWPLPESFVAHVLAGKPFVTQPPHRFAADAFASWYRDLNTGERVLEHLAQREIGCLVERLAWHMHGETDAPLRRRTGTKMSRTQMLLSRVIDHVAKHCTPDLTVAGIADHLGYNRKYLTTRFRELSGVSLQTYIRHVKVSRGQALLTGTTLSIEEVAWSAGFGSVRQFYDTIKTETGMTPRQVRLSGGRGNALQLAVTSEDLDAIGPYDMPAPVQA